MPVPRDHKYGVDGTNTTNTTKSQNIMDPVLQHYSDVECVE